MESAIMWSMITVFIICLLGSAAFLFQGPQFVPSNDKSTQEIVAAVKKYGAKKILDMGSGDGKLVIALAKEGFIVDGVELNPLLVKQSRNAIKKAGLQDKATIYQGSFWNYDTSKYDMIVVYIVQHVMGRLERKLTDELRPGSFVVSNFFTFPTKQHIEEKSLARVYKF